MLALLAAVLLAASPTPTPLPAPLCPPLTLDPSIRFTPGEALSFKLDIFGADIGTFMVTLEAPPREERRRAELVIRARTRTSAFLTAAGAPYVAEGVALVGKGLAPLRWHEEIDDGNQHRMNEFDLPPTTNPQTFRASKDGNAETLKLPMSPAARDLLSAFLAVRSTPLAIKPDGVCLEVFAGRRMWKVVGGPVVKERIETPLGMLDTVRIDVISTRVDDPKVVRKAQFWVTNDARRLPVVALAEVRGKYIRAQLVKATKGNAPR